jgi:hypothetical protein
MIRVSKIIKIGSGCIICELNNGLKKRIEIGPLLIKHAHLRGIERLKDEDFLKTAQVGACGEIFWKDAVYTSNQQCWNYDISPEFIYAFPEAV